MTSTQIELAFGHDAVAIDVPSEKLVGTFLPRALPPVSDSHDALRKALANPVSSPRLRDLAANASRAAIAIEDASRPVPNALLIDAVMSELNAAGVAPSHVKVVVATGLHRPLTDDEMTRSLGRWSGLVACENHDPHDPQRLIPLGTTSLGTEISINRTFMEADLKITTGDVEYHQFCGYGGGVKCVYPGLADAGAIRANHSRMDLPGTGPGRIDGNPVREEIDEVGRMADVGFNVSLVLDAAHRIVAVRAGDPYQSLCAACRFVDEMYAVEVPRRADLVVASAGGHPKDIELYQAQKAIEEATQVVEPGGNVLIAARCEEGSGSPLFEQWMEAAWSAEDVVQRIRSDFVMGGHKAYQIAREVQRANVHLYSQLPPGRVRAWMMNPVRSMHDIDGLIDQARSIIVLPQATLVRAIVPS